MLSLRPHQFASRFARGPMFLAGLLATAAGIHAQTSVIDDYEAGTNQNKFLGYTYFYQDAADGGTTVINSAKPNGTGTTQTWLFDKTLSLDQGANGSVNSLKLDFTYGANKPKSCGGTCAYGQFAGFGTQLVSGTDNGNVLDLSAAGTAGAAISFWAKASVAMSIRVELTTSNVTDDGYFVASEAVTTTWTKYTLLLATGLGGFARPTWAETATPGVRFALDSAQKVQFSVSADDNLALTAGTLDVDDIQIAGYSWVPPTACVTCVGAFGAGTGALLSDLEGAHPTQNTVGGFWFAYNDVGARTVTAQADYSEIFEGVSLTNPTPTAPILTATAGKGTNTTNVAYIRFNLGPAYQQDTNTIQPFVGVGTLTSDNLGTEFMDATASTGISFDYWTDTAAAIPYIRLEAYQQSDIGKNDGKVHQVLLPNTQGVWKSATVPWTKLKLPDWDGVVQTALTTNALAKFQWAVQGTPKTTGAIAVDNVKIVGMTTLAPLAGIYSTLSHSKNGLQVSQGFNGLQVSYQLPADVHSVEFRLLDLKGVRVANQRVSGSGSVQAGISTENLHTGVYTLQIIAGKNSGITQPITLLK